MLIYPFVRPQRETKKRPQGVLEWFVLWWSCLRWRAGTANRPTLLSAETSRYELEITQLDDGRFELGFIDWDLESGDDTMFESVARAKLAAEELTGVTPIVWRSPPHPPSDTSA